MHVARGFQPSVVARLKGSPYVRRQSHTQVKRALALVPVGRELNARVVRTVEIDLISAAGSVRGIAIDRRLRCPDASPDNIREALASLEVLLGFVVQLLSLLTIKGDSALFSEP